MRKSVSLALFLLSVVQPSMSWSSDACSTRAITAAADVVVSDGSKFKIETYFHTKDVSAIRRIGDPQQLIVAEGPTSWTQVGDKSDTGTEFHKLFALGHQFHAFVLHFEEIVSNVRRRDDVLFDDEARQATSGDYPYGGEVHLIHGADEMRPLGLLFEFAEDTVISVKFDDWRSVEKVSLPYQLKIDDGQRVFDYHYSEVKVTPQSPLWFFDAVPMPPLDNVQVHRLHRKLLAAHCLGDADMMADLSTPEILTASRGSLVQATNEAIRERFKALFRSLNYAAYHDLAMPVIQISEDARFGWIGVNVLAEGSEIETGTSFSQQWAWIMMVKKIDDVWLHAGNASNHAD
jgi:hypothetical protein